MCFVTGVLLWVGLTAALAAVSSFFADSVAALVPGLETAGAKSALIVVVFALLAGLNVRGVRGASRFNTVMTAAKLLPLLVFVVFGFLALRQENLRWARVPASGEIARASLLLIFAFLGIEAALVPG